jgi:hypothetical protein
LRILSRLGYADGHPWPEALAALGGRRTMSCDGCPDAERRIETTAACGRSPQARQPEWPP